MRSLTEIRSLLAESGTSAVELVGEALSRARDPAGEGARAFTRLYAESAAAAASRSDARLGKGGKVGPLAGIPISIKDLFDMAGETTLAGSVACRGEPPAVADAPAVARLKAAGAVILGKTNMTEFAFSGLGLNPHYGTPLNPWDRATRRIPGGSSSGAAVSVADGMAAAALGTDTGGSLRIPAALCGLVGFKPTAGRVPRAGAFPLSSTLDSVGPIAASVACCALLDCVLSGDASTVPVPEPARQVRLAAPQQYVLEGMDAAVGTAFERAKQRLAAAGVQIDEISLAELDALPEINAKGGFAAYEAWAIHRERLQRSAERYDPRVRVRIARGREMNEADYRALGERRAQFIARIAGALAGFDAWLAPTVPVIPPALGPLEASDEAYASANMLALRNPSIANFLDGCSISIPCHEPGGPPVGLMLSAARNADRRLLAIGLTVQALLSHHSTGENRALRT